VRVLIAHPSPDVYGSDLQLVETVRGLVETGAAVTVVLPASGPLVRLLAEAGAEVALVPFPVLRKALMRPAGLWTLARDVARFLRVRGVWRETAPDLVLVNTLTLPWWMIASRLRRVPVACHVHEAEEAQPAAVRLALVAPLLLASVVAANSNATKAVLLRSVPGLRRRLTVVHNGVPGPAVVTPPRQRGRTDTLRLVQVGRLSHRKGTDVALEAVALLRAEGRDVRLRLCGAVFPGYEWFEDRLRARARSGDLAGAIEFLGHVSDPSGEVADADIVLVPSLTESFGNAAVEALLAQRPVVASRVQGLAEVLRDGRTGLLVEPSRPEALAAAIRRLADDPGLAARLAAAGRADAATRFGVAEYRAKLTTLLGVVPSRYGSGQ